MKTADEELMKPKTISLTTWQDGAGALMKHPYIGCISDQRPAGASFTADEGALMNQPTQPDLFQPEHATSKIVVSGSDLAATEQRLRDIGAVLLGFNVKGSTYTLSVIMPPGELIEAMDSQQTKRTQ